MSVDVVWLVVAAALVVLACAVVVLVVALVRLSRAATALVDTAARAVAGVNAELPATLVAARELVVSLDGLRTEIPPRLDRLDLLMEEAEATLATLRSSLEATESIVRGPVDAVANVRRGVGSLGESLVKGADRLRRRVEGTEEDEG